MFSCFLLTKNYLFSGYKWVKKTWQNTIWILVLELLFFDAFYTQISRKALFRSIRTLENGTLWNNYKKILFELEKAMLEFSNYVDETKYWMPVPWKVRNHYISINMHRTKNMSIKNIVAMVQSVVSFWSVRYRKVVFFCRDTGVKQTYSR